MNKVIYHEPIYCHPKCEISVNEYQQHIIIVNKLTLNYILTSYIIL
jgi:hypothetical protein